MGNTGGRSSVSTWFDPSRRRRGFTLVEVLVVIGIIAVLIGILLPVINKSRQASITLKCQTQLRQMYHGISMYAVDNKGRLPWGQYRISDSPAYVHGQGTMPQKTVTL